MKKYKCTFCNDEFGKETLLFRSDINDEFTICEYCIKKCNCLIDKLRKENGNVEDYIEEDDLTEGIGYEILEENDQSEEDDKDILDSGDMMPHEIKMKFDEYIVNQDEVKKTLSVAIYNHVKKCFYNKNVATDKDSIKLKKSNILLIGPSGSGKTLLVERIADILNVPFVIQDATALTKSGFAGEDVEIMLKNLIAKANGNIELAERGIVFIDEIDKLARGKKNKANGSEPGGEGVQQALLKMLEGNTISVPKEGNKKLPFLEMHKIDTSNILFICAGAFEGLEQIVENRTSKKGTIGFVNSVSSEELNEVTNEDLIKFGFMPEFIGRLPIKCTLDALDKEDLIKILLEVKGSIIDEYNILFNMDGIELEFTDTAIEAIANKAIEEGVGARGLRSIIEKVMSKVIYDTSVLNVVKVIINEECINDGKEAIVQLG